MKVTTITLEGQTGFTATISREKPINGSENIFCEIRDTANEPAAIHWTAFDDRNDQFRMAGCIQHQLDGCKGTNSMIHDYFRIIEMFAD